MTRPQTLSAMADSRSASREWRDAGLASPIVAALMIAAIVYVSLISNGSATEQLWQGRRVSFESATVGVWQYVREAITILLVVFLANGVLRSARRSSVPIRFGGFGTTLAIFIGFQVARALVDPAIPDVYALLGLRVVYFGALALLIAKYSAADRRLLVETVAKLVLPFLILELSLAVYQTQAAPPVLGQTFIGSRPWGTFSSANNLGMAAVGLAITFALVSGRLRTWGVLLSVVLAALSGSRASILAVAAVLLGLMVARWSYRLALVPVAALLFVGLYTLSSSSEISGRSISGIARLDVWQGVLTSLEDPLEVLVGAGLGSGTNAATVLQGSASIDGPAVVDSALFSVLLQAGLIGATLLLVALVWAFFKSDYRRRLLVFPALVIAGLSFNLPELTPTNILVALGIGVVLDTQRSVASSSPPRNS